MKWLNYQLPNKAIKAESLQMQALYSRKNDYRKIYLNPYSVGYWVAPNSPAQLLQELSTLPNSKGFKNPKNLTSKEWRNLQLTELTHQKAIVMLSIVSRWLIMDVYYPRLQQGV